MDSTYNKNPKSRITLIFGWILVILYCVFFIVLGLLINRQVSTQTSSFSTLTPTIVARPQLLIEQPEKNWNIQTDDFSSNDHAWSLYISSGKVGIANEQLVLESYHPDKVTIATSKDLFPGKPDRYCVQADFTSDSKMYASYGLVFGLNRSLATFYLFEVWPERGVAQLQKYNSNVWENLLPETSIELKPYPEFNTLSVFFDKGNIQLYANGMQVMSYLDKNQFNSNNAGVLVSNMSARLIVDNFFVCSEK